MSTITELLSDLYNFDEITEYKPELHKTTYTIDNEEIKGDIFTTPEGKKVFVYRSLSKYHDNGQQWGNPWSLYSITDSKHLIIGRRTKKQIIEESGRY
jgi:hypothetical protein